jgi:hypothetical protein
VVGRCVKKDNTTEEQIRHVYLSNAIDESKEKPRQRTGTFDDPFAHMSDAIRSSRELASPYMNNVEVVVHLFKGNHYAI